MLPSGRILPFVARILSLGFAGFLLPFQTFTTIPAPYLYSISRTAFTSASLIPARTPAVLVLRACARAFPERVLPPLPLRPRSHFHSGPLILRFYKPAVSSCSSYTAARILPRCVMLGAFSLYALSCAYACGLRTRCRLFFLVPLLYLPSYLALVPSRTTTGWFIISSSFSLPIALRSSSFDATHFDVCGCRCAFVGGCAFLAIRAACLAYAGAWLAAIYLNKTVLCHTTATLPACPLFFLFHLRFLHSATLSFFLSLSLLFHHLNLSSLHFWLDTTLPPCVV